MGLLISVSADVDEHLVPSIETPPFASTALPVAAVPRILLRLDMEVVDMVHQVLQGVKEQMALLPATGQLFIR